MPSDLDNFYRSLAAPQPPPGLPPLAQALWWEARGDWHRAHEIAQEIDTADAALVHAYLHRREGDAGNAAYWYRRAGQPRRQGSLDEERNTLIAEFTSR